MNKFGKNDGIDPKVKARIIGEYIKSSKSEKKDIRPSLARALLGPIRQRLDYQSIGRKTFAVDQLPEEKCPECGYVFGVIYDHDTGIIHPDNGCSLGHIYNVMEV